MYRRVIFLFVILAGAVSAQAAFWNVEFVYYGGFASGDSALAIDNENIAHVSYTANGGLYYSTRDIEGWLAEYICEVGFWGGWSSLEFNSARQPCIAFVDGTSYTTNYLKYAYKSSGVWISESVDNIGWLPDRVSLRFNASGQACIAYSKTVGSSCYVYCARRTGTNSWVKESICQVADVIGPSLLSVADTLYVTFIDPASGVLKLATKVGTQAWNVQVLDSSSTTPAIAYTSLARQPNGKPAVAYFRIRPTDVELRYATRGSNSWQIESVRSLATGAPYYCALAITTGGIPMIGYQDPSDGKLKNTWKSGGMWFAETIDPAPNTGISLCMKMDSLGNVNASFFDASAGDIKYAVALGPTPIGLAKTLRDAETVQISGVVATTSGGELEDKVYVQEMDRSSGIQLRFTGTIPQIARGMILDIQGPMNTNDGERTVVDPQIGLVGTTSTPIALGMRNAVIGGGDFYYQPNPFPTGQRGVSGGYGLNNIGLLIRTWGRIISVGSGNFIIEDGSGIRLKCKVSGFPIPPLGSYVIVTGISSCEINGSDLVRLLRVRNANDIIKLI